MPFTFSHPAIVLPLYRLWPRWLSLTGLVAGSIVPDFEYFIRLRVHSKISHTIPGLFLFDLPMAMLLALLFHLLVRNPLILHLPAFLKHRFSRYLKVNWLPYLRQHFWVVAGSMLLGAFSHQFWDGFTHEPEFFVDRMPTLRRSVELAGQKVEVYRIIQHTSSIVGAAIIAWYVYRLPAIERAAGAKANWWYWPVVMLAALLIFMVRIVLPQNFQSTGNMAVAIISGSLLGLLIASALTRSTTKQSA